MVMVGIHQAKEILFVRSLLNSYISQYTGQPIDKIQVRLAGRQRRRG